MRDSGAPGRRPVVYISGPLQAAVDLPEARALYEDLAASCRDAGWEPYLPHRQTDPIHDVGASPSSVFSRDMDAIASADLIIAYVGAPSSGVGAEIGIAFEREIPLIGICGPEGVASRFIEGLLGTGVNADLIRYRDDADRRLSLVKALSEWRRPREMQPGYGAGLAAG